MTLRHECFEHLVEIMPGDDRFEMCDLCHQMFSVSEGDVSYGDYAVAERRANEINDGPDAEELLRQLAIWSVQNLPVGNSVNRRVRTAVMHLVNQLREWEANTPEAQQDLNDHIDADPPSDPDQEEADRLAHERSVGYHG